MELSESEALLVQQYKDAEKAHSEASKFIGYMFAGAVICTVVGLIIFPLLIVAVILVLIGIALLSRRREIVSEIHRLETVPELIAVVERIKQASNQ